MKNKLCDLFHWQVANHLQFVCFIVETQGNKKGKELESGYTILQTNSSTTED